MSIGPEALGGVVKTNKKTATGTDQEDLGVVGFSRKSNETPEPARNRAYGKTTGETILMASKRGLISRNRYDQPSD